MLVRDLILKEFIRNGYSRKGKRREWVITNPTLLFSTSELANAYMKFTHFKAYHSAVIAPELGLIKKNSEMFRRIIDNTPFNLIDMSSVTGEHAAAFLEIFKHDDVKIRYCPVGMHPSLCKKSALLVRSGKFKNVASYKLETSPFENLTSLPSTLRSSKFQKNVMMIMGSVLASFELSDFLFHMNNNMFWGDVLVMGNGIRKGQRLVNLQTYRHPAFNSWFIHIMKELGFNEREVRYDARFGNKRIECFYTILADKTLNYSGRKIEFKKGDEILVAVIYKYYERELRKLCRMYFSRVDFIKDEKGEYALMVCRK